MPAGVISMTFGLQVGRIVLVTVGEPFGIAYPVTFEFRES